MLHSRAALPLDRAQILKGSNEPAIWKLVGNTPLLPLEDGRGVRTWGAEIWLKAEWCNPGGSVKDRPALAILKAGIAAGELPGKRLLDASSGNTAIAYAMLARSAGVGITICLPANASEERRALLQIYGAEVIETDPLEGSDGAIRRARELASSQSRRYWYADQYSNPANPEAHYRSTGPELWRQTRGRITHLVAGVGTGGTIMGAGRFLKERRPEICLIGVQPDSGFHGLEGLKHMATAMVPAIYDASRLDQTVYVSTEEAERKVRELALGCGLLVGWSAGAALVAAEMIARQEWEGGRKAPPVIVVIAPDSGTRYLSERERFGIEAGR
ncbi:MAG: cysteine synthase [Gemmatimonadales bacterium]|nr:MAG: cysteine synthase [Gemmatimonadales bacterium]